MIFNNLTPHVLNVWDNNGVEHVIAPYTNENGERLEIRASTQLSDSLEHEYLFNTGFSVKRNVMGEPVAVWVAKDKTTRPANWDEVPPAYCIVSKLALQSLNNVGRVSIKWLTPGELIRNEAGQPIGCKGFEI